MTFWQAYCIVLVPIFFLADQMHVDGKWAPFIIVAFVVWHDYYSKKKEKENK